LLVGKDWSDRRSHQSVHQSITLPWDIDPKRSCKHFHNLARLNFIFCLDLVQSCVPSPHTYFPSRS
jgi:hypothetical protein